MSNDESGNSKEIEQALETLSQMRTLIRGNLQVIRPLFHDLRFGILGFGLVLHQPVSALLFPLQN